MTDAKIFEDYARKIFANEKACACVLPFESRDIISEQQETINRQKAEIETCYEFIEQLEEARNIWDDKCKHQQAEIERLQKELEEAAVTIHDAAKRYSEYKKLIQCQKEEIERLQSILLKFVREINIFENKHNIDTSDFSLIPILENEKNSIVKQIKDEARKEFAERLKYSVFNPNNKFDWFLDDVDNLVEEMAGDTE